jgi:hypothetical protein
LDFWMTNPSTEKKVHMPQILHMRSGGTRSPGTLP